MGRDQDRENGVEQPNVEMPDKRAQKPDDVVEAIDATSVAQGVVEDHADIQNAQAESREQLSGKTKSLLRIGPGLITGVADDDPSGIGTYSVAGAQFGYQLLWLAPMHLRSLLCCCSSATTERLWERTVTVGYPIHSDGSPWLS